MKYFTNYIPIKDKPKKGDLGYRILTNGNRASDIMPMDDFTIPTQFQKVKLFLCSRDIQVDDMVRQHLESDEITEEFEWSSDMETHRRNEFVKADLFKVIGEISPQAIWVKEGDEFEEDDWTSGNKGITNPPFIEVQIKCPTCKTFH